MRLSTHTKEKPMAAAPMVMKASLKGNTGEKEGVQVVTCLGGCSQSGQRGFWSHQEPGSLTHVLLP